MEEAAEERRNHHTVEDGRIQLVNEVPETDMVNGDYVHAFIYDAKNTENRRSYEPYQIKINGLDLKEAVIEMNSNYKIIYERDSDGVLEVISFWKEESAP